jgi:drug/metabolite transporter (DMT)-like permease
MFATVSAFAGLVFLASTSAVMEVPQVPQMSAVDLLLRPSFYGPILFLSVFCSLLAFSWMNRYQPSVTAVQAAVIYTLEPVFTSAWALVLPGVLSTICGIGYSNEELTMSLLIGGGLVLLANGLALGCKSSDASPKND